MRKKRDPIFRVKPDPDYFTLFEVSIRRKKLRWEYLSIKEIHDQWLQFSGDNLKLAEDSFDPIDNNFIFFEHNFDPFGYRYNFDLFCNQFNLRCDNFSLFSDNFKLFCDHFNLCFDNFNQQYFAFYLSVMVIMIADSYQRSAIQRKTARGARNIPFKQQRVQNDLRIAMGKANIKMRMLNRIFETAFTDLKEELGFPKKNKYEFCYEILDRILVKAPQKCRDHLAKRRPKKLFFKEQFDIIKVELKNKFPDEAPYLIKNINKTKSRQHLSAISLSTDYDETFVHIVSPQNKQIKMEAWKFLNLLEDPEKPKLLYDFEASESRKYNHKFIFNTRTDGRVEGAFFRENSTLRCIRFEQKKTNEGERVRVNLGESIGSANFMLDTYYIFCLYTVLKKLKDDKIRFEELKEKASVAVSNEDHYKKIALIDLLD